MKRRKGRYNRKRKIRGYNENDTAKYNDWAQRASYGGNPEHKMNPGDFGLMPPASPRSAKSLCDSLEIFDRAKALEYLKQGLAKGMVSETETNGWPQNVWAVDENSNPLEAQLENRETGAYHGYPMPESDPFVRIILDEWKRRP